MDLSDIVPFYVFDGATSTHRFTGALSASGTVSASGGRFGGASGQLPGSIPLPLDAKTNQADNVGRIQCTNTAGFSAICSYRAEGTALTDERCAWGYGNSASGWLQGHAFFEASDFGSTSATPPITFANTISDGVGGATHKWRASFLGDHSKFAWYRWSDQAIAATVLDSGAAHFGGNVSPQSALSLGNGLSNPSGLATLSLTGPNTAPEIATKPGIYHRHQVGLGVYSDYAISFEVNGGAALAEAARFTNDGKLLIGSTTDDASGAIVQVTGAVKATIFSGNLAASNLTGAPKFSANNAGDAQTIANVTNTKLTLAAEAWDTNGNYDTSASRFTPTVAGKYLLTGAVQYASPIRIQLKVYKNGSLEKLADIGGDTYGASIACVVDANGSTDYFELWTLILGGPTDTEGNAAATWFQGSLQS